MSLVDISLKVGFNLDMSIKDLFNIREFGNMYDKRHIGKNRKVSASDKAKFGLILEFWRYMGLIGEIEAK